MTCSVRWTWADIHAVAFTIQIHACLGVLAQAKVLSTDEMRRTLEGMELDETYANLDYYRSTGVRWCVKANLDYYRSPGIMWYVNFFVRGHTLHFLERSIIPATSQPQLTSHGTVDGPLQWPS